MVIVIAGILAAFSGPLFFNVQVFRERGFFDEAVSAVRYAQKYAVASGCAVNVVITGNILTLNRGAGCNVAPYATPLTDPSGGTVAFTRTAPPDVAVTDANFLFVPNGSATVAYPSLTISVGTRTFTVYQQTGFVGVP